MNKRNDAPLYLFGGAIAIATLAAFAVIVSDGDVEKFHNKTITHTLEVGTPNVEDIFKEQ